jgi:hypothetical protein
VTGIIMDRCIDIPFTEDPGKFFIGPAKLDIMVKDQAGDDEKPEEDDERAEDATQPPEFPDRLFGSVH